MTPPPPRVNSVVTVISLVGVRGLKKSKQSFGLIDIWRIRSPDGKITWRQERIFKGVLVFRQFMITDMRNNIITLDTRPSSKRESDQPGLVAQLVEPRQPQ